jgi:phosphoglycerate dehydrogenase-like enzyme
MATWRRSTGRRADPIWDSGVVLSVAVLDDYQRRAAELADWRSLGDEVAVEFFAEAMTQEELVPRLARFDVLVLMRERTRFGRDVLELLPELKLVITTGMGNASLDVDFLHTRGVTVCGTDLAGGHADGVPTTAEVAWALILAVAKRVTIEDRALRNGRWQRGLPIELAGRTLGLAGLGRLGGAMVGPARAFGMDVIAWSENLTPERAAEFGVERVSKEVLLGSSDVLSIHLKLSDRSRGLFGARELAQMQSTAMLINTSRGPIVDEGALIDALRSQSIAAAGLDVYDREPLPADHELLALENAVLLPHLGYVSESSLRAMYADAVQDIAAFSDGSPIRLLT